MAPCRCRVGAAPVRGGKREEGGGRRGAGRRRTWRAADSVWRLTASGRDFIYGGWRLLRDGDWRTGVWAISFLRLLGTMDEPAG
jgi:hypothetical protein